jgi:outer membrane protein
MAKNDAEVSRINNSLGSAGMLPSVSLIGSGGYAISDSKQTALDGTVKKYNGSTTTSLSSGVELNWTLFDGGKMFVTKQKLSEIQSLGELQLKEQVLSTQYDVTEAYYNVVRQKQQLTSINEIIKYNTERVKVLQTSFGVGLAAKNSLLQAKIDLNVYKENAISQQYSINTAKKSLNLILGVSIDSVYEVVDSIPLGEAVNKSEMIQKLFDVNTSILSSQKQLDIAKLALKEYSRSRYPIISFSAGYSISKKDYTNWSSKQNIALGPDFQGTISIPLYQAGRISRQVNTQKLEVETMKYNLESIKQKISTNLNNAITEYEYQLSMLEIEKENNLITKENLEISIQRLKQGETTTLEVHQAQDDYMQSCTRLVNFRYNLKVAELTLKQLLSTL